MPPRHFEGDQHEATHDRGRRLSGPCCCWPVRSARRPRIRPPRRPQPHGRASWTRTATASATTAREPHRVRARRCARERAASARATEPAARESVHGTAPATVRRAVAAPATGPARKAVAEGAGAASSQAGSSTPGKRFVAAGRSRCRPLVGEGWRETPPLQKRTSCRERQVVRVAAAPWYVACSAVPADQVLSTEEAWLSPAVSRAPT